MSVARADARAAVARQDARAGGAIPDRLMYRPGGGASRRAARVPLLYDVPVVRESGCVRVPDLLCCNHLCDQIAEMFVVRAI